MNTNKTHDNVNNPYHYTQLPVECIEIMEQLNNPLLANAFKYAWCAGLKGNTKEDLQKMDWYISRYLNNAQKPPRASVSDLFTKLDGYIDPARLGFLKAVWEAYSNPVEENLAALASAKTDFINQYN